MEVLHLAFDWSKQLCGDEKWNKDATDAGLHTTLSYRIFLNRYSLDLEKSRIS